MTLVTKKERALAMSVALAYLDSAKRDPYDDARWVYFAEETNSWWSVTSDSLVALGSCDPLNEEAYNNWAEADNTAEERGKRV